MKFVVLALVVLVTITYFRPNSNDIAPSALKVADIRTDKIQIYQPSAFCWWCSCFVTEPSIDPWEKEYLRLVAANL